MPFRTCKGEDSTPKGNVKLLDPKRRTGEPSPSSYGWLYPEGYGKARGSYTEAMRQALWSWMEAHGYVALQPLTFDYKLYRHKTVTVVAGTPYIKHEPGCGRGKKGFVLIAMPLSIDGVRCRTFPQRMCFAWDRIVGRERFLGLPEGKKVICESTGSDSQS